MCIVCCVEDVLHVVVSSQSVLGDDPLDISRVFPFHNVLLLSWIYFAPVGDPTAAPACFKIQAVGSFRSKENLKSRPERLNKRRKTSIMRTRWDAASAC